MLSEHAGVTIRCADSLTSDADEINGNSVRKPLTWNKSGDVGSLADRTIRLKFVMRDTKRYAFLFPELKDD